jgi:hypothetical protein
MRINSKITCIYLQRPQNEILNKLNPVTDIDRKFQKILEPAASSLKYLNQSTHQDFKKIVSKNLFSYKKIDESQKLTKSQKFSHEDRMSKTRDSFRIKTCCIKLLV